MKMKKNNRSQYNINGPSSRHGCKYSQYKTCLSMMMLICIKQLRSSIWSSIHEKVKQHWRWVEKKCSNLNHLNSLKNVHVCPNVHVSISDTPPWVYFTFLKMYKWYQIAQSITNHLKGTTVLGFMLVPFFFIELEEIIIFF